MVLTAQRLQKLATWEHLSNTWYIIATVTLTVCNKPQEIPKLYHYALHTHDLKETPSTELYNKCELIEKKFQDIKATGTDLGYNPYSKYDLDKKIYQTTDKMRECILKTSALSGLPKAINSLMILKDTTPLVYRTNKDLPNRKPITNWEDYEREQKRGEEYWNNVYTKISNRVTNQMSSSYADLWEYTISHVYSPLLSYNEILTPKETSLVVISSLVPQDVIPQLKGHVKGALNAGIPKEEVESAQNMARTIGAWCTQSRASQL